MDVKLLYDTIGEYAMQTQNVAKYTTGSVYVVWNSMNMQYPAFDADLNYVQYSDNTVTINLSLYYAGKAKNDSSNIYDLQSEGINAISTVLKLMENGIEMDNIEYVQIQPFTQKFADILAGAWCTVDIVVPTDPCELYLKD